MMEDTDTVYCYLVRKNTRTWYLARDDCLNSDSDLLSITSEKEQEFVTKHLLAESFMWIGYNDLESEGKWAWSDRYCDVSLIAINSSSTRRYVLYSSGKSHTGDVAL